MKNIIDLNKYLGHTISCPCGKIHKTDLKIIDICENAASHLPIHMYSLGFQHAFLVADVNTYAAAGIYAEEALQKEGLLAGTYIFPDAELIPDEFSVGRLVQVLPKSADVILVAGSGTLNDLCKFVSYQCGLEYMVFASAPSMDGFVSVGAALITDHVKTTYDAHVPIAVIADTEILASAPMEMITAGLGDILGKYTCLLDWKIAHLIEGEYYCEDISDMVKNSVYICTEQGPKIKSRDPEAVKAVMEALLLTGIAMSFTGNSRPASGSEHHLSHYWEMQFQMQGKKPILHGIKVGVGMLTSIYMYQKLLQEAPVFSEIKDCGFDYPVWEEKVKSCYLDAANGILELEKACRKNDIPNRNKRLAIIEEKWDSIKDLISAEIPSLKMMKNLLASLDAPINPAQIGISSVMVEDAILLAKEVRNRYTILQLLWDLGLLSKYAKDTASYFAEEDQKIL